jgi:hypothetical protein
MINEKKRGPGSRQPTGPKRKDQTKRPFKFRENELKSQESLLLFLFVENCSKILTEPMIELIWNFMEFLKSTGYHIVNEKEVFCFPFSKLARKGDLK